jgi:hypothetical protein
MPAAGLAAELRRAMRLLMEVGPYGKYEVMSKEAYNQLIGQAEMWSEGEHEALRDELCVARDRTRDLPPQRGLLATERETCPRSAAWQSCGLPLVRSLG